MFLQVKLPFFIDIKPPDTEVLKQIIPDGWTKKKLNVVSVDAVPIET